MLTISEILIFFSKPELVIKASSTEPAAATMALGIASWIKNTNSIIVSIEFLMIFLRILLGLSSTSGPAGLTGLAGVKIKRGSDKIVNGR